MIRIGLLGASRISRGAILEPARDLEDVIVSTVAARDPDRASQFAREEGIAGVEPNYAALVASSNVDLVYNGLPPSEHARWTIEALKAGKHVLCEKPFAMNADEASAMVEASLVSEGQLIEAFHYRFHPAFQRLLDLVEEGTIGRLQRLEAYFNVPIAYSPGELRYEPALGGGAMMDLGCYPVHWVRTVMQEEPRVESASSVVHQAGVDVRTEADLAFPSGVVAHVHASMAEDLPNGLDDELRLHGEDGEIVFQNPLVPNEGHEIVLRNAAGETREVVPGRTTYHHQLRHVLDVLAGRQLPITGGDDSINNMRVLDHIYAHAGRGSDW